MDARKTSVANDGWNLVEGCTKVSEGCKQCFVEYQLGKDRFNKPVCRPERLLEPADAVHPRTFFLSDAGDLLHPVVPDDFVRRAIFEINSHPRHQYRICTKRPERLPRFEWPYHAAIGVSVEHQEALDERAPWLKSAKTYCRFISAQPLLGPLDLTGYEFIDHVVVGGEYGTDARPLELDWVRSLRDQCAAMGITFTFQQMQDAHGIRVMGPKLDGKRHLSNIDYYEGR